MQLAPNWPREEEVASALSNTLESNPLLHLDLSQNQLDAKDCDLISIGLKQNHTLLGLHMTGNQASVDCYGNLVRSSLSLSLSFSYYSAPLLPGPSIFCFY